MPKLHLQRVALRSSSQCFGFAQRDPSLMITVTMSTMVLSCWYVMLYYSGVKKHTATPVRVGGRGHLLGPGIKQTQSRALRLGQWT